jgi:hypothetical protein
MLAPGSFIQLCTVSGGADALHTLAPTARMTSVASRKILQLNLLCRIAGLAEA